MNTCKALWKRNNIYNSANIANYKQLRKLPTCCACRSTGTLSLLLAMQTEKTQHVVLFACSSCIKAPDAPPHAFICSHRRTQQQDAGTPTIHLANTVACLCKQAGIQGHKINHSLWATVASRLYQAGVDEQLVMERTGYRSLDCIRSYQQTSEDLCQISQSQYVWAVILTLWNKHRQPFSHPPPLNFSSPMFNNCTVNFLVGSNPSESKHQRRAIVIDTDWLTEDNGEPCADSVLYTCY